MVLKKVLGRLFGAPPGSPSQLASDARQANDDGAAEEARRAGNAALAQGHVDEALTHYERFVHLAPSNASAHINRAFALMRLGRLADAEAGFRDARQLDPAHHEAALFLGLCQEEQQRLPESAEQYRACVQLAPEVEEGWLALARVQERCGQADEARATLRRAARKNDGFAGVWRNLAGLALQAEDWPEALAATGRRLYLVPDDAQSHAMRSEALRKLRRPAEALAAADRALALGADDGTASLMRGMALLELQRSDEAQEAMARAVEVEPDNPVMLSGLAIVEIAHGNYEIALQRLEHALDLAPGHVPALHNKALALARLLRVEETLVAFERVVAALPTNPTLHFDYGVALLAVGRWRLGWREYEWRLRLPGYVEAPMARGLRWLEPGADVQGRRVLLTVEQGLGDTLQFLRYVPMLAARGAEVAMWLPPRLAPLLPEPWPGCRFVREGDRIEVDLHCKMMSLPHLLQIDEPLPMTGPYVQADSSRLAHWRGRVDSTALLRVGLVWAGNPEHPDDARRSLTLEPIRQALADLPAVQFISLQMATPTRDEAAAQAWPQLVRVGAEQRDMADTAALVQALDLVVSVDTSVAHLVGALQLPLWLLLQHCPDWRWGLQGESTPWYPTTRLFRQARAGDWSEPLARVRGELLALCGQRAGQAR